MLCCVLLAALLGPLGLWAMPRAKLEAGPDCCTVNWRRAAAIGLIAVSVAALGLAGLFLSRTGPIYFRHICSVWTSP